MLRFLTAGESHGPQLTAMLEGLPAGLQLDIDQLQTELAKRQQGYGRGGRMQIEKDRAQIVSGVRFGETLGSPLTLVIENRDWQNWQERMAVNGEPCGATVTAARPGHADLTGILKYQRQDIRDILERASARETAARVAVGAIAKQLLQQCGITVASYVNCIGGVRSAKEAYTAQEALIGKEHSDLSCIDPASEEVMKQTIKQAKEAGDTLGGTFVVLADNVPPGLGSHVQWDRRLDAQLSAALVSIPAIKGVSFGAGFDYAHLPGSQSHDPIYYNETTGYYRTTNRAGGLEGGMSNGETILLTAVMKPIPTLMQPLASVDITNHSAVSASTERSDVCAVSAAAVVGEAMTSFILAQALLEKFPHDTMKELAAALQEYRQRILSS